VKKNWFAWLSSVVFSLALAVFAAQIVRMWTLIHFGESPQRASGKQIPANWNYTPGPGNSEPGKKLQDCYEGYTYESG